MKHAAKYTYKVEEVPGLVAEMYKFIEEQTSGAVRISVEYDYQRQRHTVAVFSKEK